jgi:hypothetical protein
MNKGQFRVPKRAKHNYETVVIPIIPKSSLEFNAISLFPNNN